MDGIYRIDVASQGMSAFSNIYIENFGKVVHGGTGEEISSVVDVNVPNGLSMVFESMGTGGVYKVPDFDCGISTGSENMKTFGMESDRSQPLFVPLA